MPIMEAHISESLQLRPSVRSLVPALRSFGPRGWGVAVIAAVVSAVLTGIPMVMIRTPWFIRMTPVRPQDWVIWLTSAGLLGLIAATYTVHRRADARGRTVAGGFLSYLAIGCPVCNKVAVMLLGVGGALTVFGPAQLVIGVCSLVLLAWTLLLRADAVTAAACPASPRAGTATITRHTQSGPWTGRAPSNRSPFRRR